MNSCVSAEVIIYHHNVTSSKQNTVYMFKVLHYILFGSRGASCDDYAETVAVAFCRLQRRAVYGI